MTFAALRMDAGQGSIDIIYGARIIYVHPIFWPGSAIWRIIISVKLSFMRMREKNIIWCVSGEKVGVNPFFTALLQPKVESSHSLPFKMKRN